ncbi:hypothetical protein NE865_00678 [Phthorimaea operculella]|nr:hypothetical protein NE865_00678 [Phthorimaea operculella]
MRFEIPLCKRCCFCVPLRYGLLVWSYLVLVPQALLLLAEIWSLVLMERRLYYYHWTKVLRTMIYITLLSANIVLIFLLIVASHKKSPKLLKIYSKCGLTAAGATFVCFLLDFMYNFAVEGISMFDEWPIILTTTLIQLIFVGE